MDWSWVREVVARPGKGGYCSNPGEVMVIWTMALTVETKKSG